MNLGVLLLYCKDTNAIRASAGPAFMRFTREWAAAAVGRVAAYFATQSAGREAVAFKVFDWIELSKTEAEWAALGVGAYAALRKELEEKTGELDAFDHILIGIDHSASSGGRTPGTLTHLAASNFTPSLIAHELGHRFGAPDAFLEVPGAERRYENKFCVMGGANWPAVFDDSAIADPTLQLLNQSGPGMSAPSLLATGWLKEDEHGLGIELSDTNLFSVGGAVVELAALAGAPGPLWQRPPVVLRYRDLLVEYRVAAADGWDRGLPDPGGASAGGWVVVHRSPRNAPRALFVNAVEARPGAVVVLGKDEPFDLFNPGPVTIRVLSFNAAARTVRFQVARRAARELPGATTDQGVDAGGGGLMWTPGRGFTRVPPHSPLIRVLDAVARLQSLQETMAIASRDEVAELSAEATQALRSLERRVSRLRVEASVSPLAHGLAELERAARELGSAEVGVGAREALGAASRRLAEVKEILARAVEEERGR